MGNPVGDGHLQPRGCGCEGCRGARLVRLARDWPGLLRYPCARDPRAQGMQNGLTGSDRGLSGRKEPDRQETTYCRNADLLMKATDDELATTGWVGGSGWAGLIRALFLTLCSEPGYPRDDPSLALRRFEDMKEKYGELAVYLASYSPYQDGACRFIETISAYVPALRSARRTKYLIPVAPRTACLSNPIGIVRSGSNRIRLGSKSLEAVACGSQAPIHPPILVDPM